MSNKPKPVCPFPEAYKIQEDEIQTLEARCAELEKENKFISECRQRQVDMLWDLKAKLAEVTAAIMRLPEPGPAIGDGPDERVGYVMRELEKAKDATRFEYNGRFNAEKKIQDYLNLGVDPWRWMRGEDNHLESISCPILIWPEDMKELIATKISESQAEVARLRLLVTVKDEEIERLNGLIDPCS